MICFGAPLHRRFCIDTVFVVAGAQPWTPGATAGLDVDEAFVVCTAQSLTPTAADAGRGGCSPGCLPDTELELTLFRGATIDDPVHGMFSFVLARTTDHQQPRFQRLAVDLPGLINPASRQSTRGARRALPIEDVREAWRSLRDQALAQGLVLAAYLATPSGASSTASAVVSQVLGPEGALGQGG